MPYVIIKPSFDAKGRPHLCGDFVAAFSADRTVSAPPNVYPTFGSSGPYVVTFDRRRDAESRLRRLRAYYRDDESRERFTGGYSVQYVSRRFDTYSAVPMPQAPVKRGKQ